MNAIAPLVAAQPDVRLFADIEEAARDAQGALDRACQPSLYDRIDWLRLTRAHVLPHARPIIARAALGGHRTWLFLQQEGNRARAFASWYTLAFAPVFDAPVPEHAALLEALAAALRARFARIELAPLPADATTALADAFAAQGWSVDGTDATANWVAHTAGRDFAAYWAARPSRLRNTLRRKARAADCAITILDRFDARAWADYEAIYRASWKPEEGSPDFLRALAEQEGAAGTLRLGVAQREGRAIACQVWTVEQGVATIHKLAHLESERAWSPGTILSEAMFRHAIDRDRVALIDFGTGDDAYKADWMDERRMLRRLTLFNRRSLTGIAGAAGAALRRRVRHG